ncbi:MAG TPA: MFS transporter, partial [Steroidobacteraceae bacterium]|nr:MFS transporter [Steroidobacteraceae bacterium]
MASAESTAGPLFSRGYRTWLLTVLLLTNAMNLADRQGIAAVAQAVKLDLKFSDAQMGLIQGLGFAIFYSLLGLPIARLAERVSRTKIIAGSLGIFGVMVALCGSATSFWRLLLFRIGVGIGDAGFIPPTGSLVADHYPKDKRASVMSIIWLGAPVGVVAGSTFAGWMAEHYSWRAAFVGIGLPALVVSLVAFFTLREPPRGMFDDVKASSGPPPSMGAVLRFLFAKPSFRHILMGCGLAATSMNAIGQ